MEADPIEQLEVVPVSNEQDQGWSIGKTRMLKILSPVIILLIVGGIVWLATLAGSDVGQAETQASTDQLDTLDSKLKAQESAQVQGASTVGGMYGPPAPSGKAKASPTQGAKKADEPTATPNPTATPTPTNTPAPEPTATPTPTNTPEPTATPTPTLTEPGN